MSYPRSKMFKVGGILLKVIPYYDHQFAISPDGKYVWVRERITKSGRLVAGRWLKPSLNDRYYNAIMQVSIPSMMGSKQPTMVSVGRLVAYAYIGPPPYPNYVIKYKNGDKLDNHYTNLEWISKGKSQQNARWDNAVAIKDDEEDLSEEFFGQTDQSNETSIS
jgi:hypothetical protein